MKKYILCRVDEVFDPLEGSVERRPVTQDIRWPEGTVQTFAIHPTEPWALIQIVHPVNVLPIPGNIDADELPDVALDVKISAIHVATRERMKSDIAKRGISSSFVDNSDGYREVIRTLGQRVDPNFDEDRFGLPG